MEMSLDQLEELAKQDGVEYLELNKSQCYHYVVQKGTQEEYNHYNAFMKGCYDQIVGGKCKQPRKKTADWRNDYVYGFNYANYVRSPNKGITTEVNKC